MWFNRYDERLSSWYQLREGNRDNNLEQSLLNINDWWQQTPWAPYYLHWDDLNTWPDPWDLLADNHFCTVARALGIVYTIHMLDRSDITAVEIALNGDFGDNLVLVNKGKYILNWTQGQLLNITSPEVKIVRTLDSQAVTKKIN